MNDPRMPGPLLEARDEYVWVRNVVARCLSPEAARRVVERMNQTWREAWDDELRSKPVTALSEWFPGTQAPWEPGLYRTRGIEEQDERYWYWRFWDGENWRQPRQDACHAFTADVAGHAPALWRGLAAPTV